MKVRRITKFALDDILILLKPYIKSLTHSNLYRTLKRHNLNQLPKEDNINTAKIKFKDYNIGYVHIDITQLMVNTQKCYLFVAIRRVCKYAYIELYHKQTAKNACNFLKNMMNDFPFKVHIILTDNGTQFSHSLFKNHKQYTKAPSF